MTITLQAVNELIQSLESAGELSIREQKFLKLAKAYQQLAAENVELKQSERELDKTCAEEFGQDWVSEFTETPATDRIVAEAEARGVEKFAAHLRANDNGASVCKMIALGADDFAKQLREGDGK
ncbi:hypothetical protein L7H29_005599 [Klebsiella pneumoniae]|uniref:hypothetical protein n=1 Tax=Klebsiella pneumoniae TaxID=573 RepID=UPI0027318811|nr:hypothetical protein [Klebsiella pneumoniae]EKU2609873.1 hypothetical protein [Klebsiella pneumoniae]EKU3918182.1 hypothetical protein [Klebsiella pneumoniae]EKU3934739.1 hypothetical protein [Klebsiella pneumoniae]EKX7974629.1 hypothetical protein [Klebsiella pneumoniae]EKX9090506.1 hypothetical protein [Klebsiella pneumoniae]